ncbi:protein of unknown function DUF2231, transmembrane [Methylocaldum marinum]|uniref:DUF2231 domain-containing protein n=1 Tax=Methylocaldum marinum TaxID=1432792 RepID=A0A250KZN8_9GAMM|nr:DUF2231 domain-containing protein [Methylocaldum marinum]BBA37153.1 protein of unknown function DUF2231, transmembrane [Methylocaldum marinum]
MQSRAKILGHPAHSTLIVFPLGLLATGVVFDIIYLMTDSPSFLTVAYWMIAAGIIGGLVAAPFGLIDWLAIPSHTRAKFIGLVHGVGNLIVLLLFIGSWWLRRNIDFPGAWAFVLSFAGLALVLITGWLGGELVDRLGVGVDDDADLNAPNSLSKRLTH